MSQSDLCDYSGAYTAVKTITVADLNNNAYDKKLGFAT